MHLRHFLAPFVLVLAACGSSDDSNSGVHNEDEARRAYLGLDASIDKAITLGFDGYNAASNANIPPQSTTGVKTGTLTVTGTVDKGASNNKTMKLGEALVTYSDDGEITYDNAQNIAAPELQMKLSNVPDGTVSGTLDGTYAMSGGLTGNVVLAVTFTATLEPDPTDGTKVRRKPGTTHITGTASSPGGTYNVDVTK